MRALGTIVQIETREAFENVKIWPFLGTSLKVCDEW